jgi:hypothetical protein
MQNGLEKDSVIIRPKNKSHFAKESTGEIPDE